MNLYDHKEIEKKWQKKWEEEGFAKIDKDNSGKEKFYVLDMFPYPSGDGLHMGHTESYTATDIIYRHKRMKGYSTLHPQGFDSFGLPAENYAIKTGTHPKITTAQNIENYIGQMKSLGFGYDFDEKIITSSPEYYKWTQWLFVKFFEHGLVYKKTASANWCDSCKTVLANEQVVDGKCERCKSEIVQKDIPGWFFKITDFAEELISGLSDLDWPEHTKKNQINWIGKSEGALLKFKVKSQKSKVADEIEVFTTRPDTLFGATYIVLAPEHQLISKIKSQISNFAEVEGYTKLTKKKTERERIENREKTGEELKGIKAINPANNEEIPIFIADYVLAHYGTGAIMAVPAHDERDFEFALKYSLPITQVIKFPHESDVVIKQTVFGTGVENFAYHPEEFEIIDKTSGKISGYLYKNIGNSCHTCSGSLENSAQFDGMDSEEAKRAITEFVGGKMTNTYRLRDWSISRQRYWGAPIPVVYDPEGKAHIIPEEYLPWTLPEGVDFMPTGTAPLAKSKELQKRTEEIFGKGWTPETDTMDTFVCSSWYYLRYPDPHNNKEFCSTKRLSRWLPVDLYIGGAEHTYMHLLYARFFTKAMHKIGLLSFDEPFLKLRHQGMVLDKNGVKMSKSKGNVINPDDVVERFGADATRLYMMFAGPLDEDVMWNEDGIVGTYRFLEKVWRLGEEIKIQNVKDKSTSKNSKLETLLHKTIKKVGEDIEEIKFNTAISAMMIFVNMAEKEGVTKKQYEMFLKLLAPFAPHITEEIWHELGHTASVHLGEWPKYDETKLSDDTITIAVQVNGKVRGMFTAEADIKENEAIDIAQTLPEIVKWISGENIKKIIYVSGKIVNIVFD